MSDKEFHDQDLCKRCPNPGQCCTSIMFSRWFPADMPRAKVQRHIRAGTDPWGRGIVTEPLPMFSVLRPFAWAAPTGINEPAKVQWYCECHRLSERTGRCRAYDKRPKLCRVFEPGSSKICAQYHGPWEDILIKDDIPGI